MWTLIGLFYVIPALISIAIWVYLVEIGWVDDPITVKDIVIGSITILVPGINILMVAVCFDGIVDVLYKYVTSWSIWDKVVYTKKKVVDTNTK